MTTTGRAVAFRSGRRVTAAEPRVAQADEADALSGATPALLCRYWPAACVRQPADSADRPGAPEPQPQLPRLPAVTVPWPASWHSSSACRQDMSPCPYWPAWT